MYDSGGVRLHSSFSVSTSTYQGVSFWINPVDLSGQDWTVAMTSPDSTLANNAAGAGPLNLFSYYGGFLPRQSSGDQWIRIVIPFYQFGIVGGTKLDGILFQLTGSEYQGSLYIDDVEFIEQIAQKNSSGAALGAGFIGIVLSCALLLLL
jgi:hypothetical protein